MMGMFKRAVGGILSQDIGHSQKQEIVPDANSVMIPTIFIELRRLCFLLFEKSKYINREA